MIFAMLILRITSARFRLRASTPYAAPMGLGEGEIRKAEMRRVKVTRSKKIRDLFADNIPILNLFSIQC